MDVDLVEVSWVVFEAFFVIFSVILFPTNPAVASVVFRSLFEAALSMFITDFLCAVKKPLSLFTSETFDHIFCQ